MTTSNIPTLHAEWLAAQPLSDDRHNALWQWIRMQFNHHSNNFEGNTLTYSETQMLLMYGRATGDHEFREYEEMKAHDVAFEHVRDIATKPHPITEVDIRDINKICLKEPFYKNAQTPDGNPTRKKIIPGEYKKQPNHVVTPTGEFFQFATPEETPAKMGELIAWLREQLATQEQWTKSKDKQIETLISFLAKLHRRFILIHPFDDGNGRTIRLLINYVLIRLQFLPIVLNDRPSYIKAIQFSDIGDISHLEKLFKDNIAAMLERGIYAKDNRIKSDLP